MQRRAQLPEAPGLLQTATLGLTDASALPAAGSRGSCWLRTWRPPGRVPSDQHQQSLVSGVLSDKSWMIQEVWVSYTKFEVSYGNNKGRSSDSKHKKDKQVSKYTNLKPFTSVTGITMETRAFIHTSNAKSLLHIPNYSKIMIKLFTLLGATLITVRVKGRLFF